MSLELLKSAFESIRHTSDWSLQLLRITSSKREGAKYASRLIFLEPDDKINSFANEIAERYLSEGKSSLKHYTSITEYNGTTDRATVYKLAGNETLIKEEYANFVNATANPDVEADTMAFKSAYLIKGSTIIGEEDTPIKMISMQSPITTLKHKFSLIHDNGKFKELDDKILSLKPTLDIIIIGDTVYFLTMNGENLFNMERAYKSVCHEDVGKIEDANMINGFDTFKSVAETGHNPRRFVSFNNERFEALKNNKTRKAIAKQFDIPLDEDGKLDATAEGAAEKIVKVLCNKGMVDPFKKAPVEVPSSKPW